VSHAASDSAAVRRARDSGSSTGCGAEPRLAITRRVSSGAHPIPETRPPRARLGMLGLALVLTSCASHDFSLQKSVNDLVGDIDVLFGAPDLPGKQLQAIADAHEKKSWTLREDRADALDATRCAVRELADCDYTTWNEAAIVVEVLSSMADEHPSSLVRAEALDTLTRMAPWIFAAAVTPTEPTSAADVIDAIKVVKQAAGRNAGDAALTAQVAGAVMALAYHPFDQVTISSSDGTGNAGAGRAYGENLRGARSVLRAVNGPTLRGFEQDPDAANALEVAYVDVSACAIRLTLLKSALVDPAETTRAAALRDIGQLAPSGGADVLARVLARDPYASVRREAAKALASYPMPQSVPALIDGLSDEMSDVRTAAARSLLTLSGETFGDDRRAWSRWWSTKSAGGVSLNAGK
jgi:HEAT repeats